MAYRVDLDKGLLVQALELAYASQKRAMNTAKNPAFKPIIEKDLTAYHNALNTITETK